MAARGQEELVFQGIGITPDVAIGKAFLVEITRPQAPKYKIAKEVVPAERARLEKAAETVRRDLEALKTRAAALPEAAAEEATLLLDAHLAMISGSRLIRGTAQKIEDDGMNAEWALSMAMQTLAVQFKALKDNYISARLDDVEAVGCRLLRALLGLPYVSLESVPQGGIVLAQEITPAEAAVLDPRRFAGLATVQGGVAGHTAVMARGLGLPAVLGVPPDMLVTAKQGDTVIIDGIAGAVVVNPSSQTLARYEAVRARLEDERRAFAALGGGVTTADGAAIELCANLEFPREAQAIARSGADGIGLFRTEFLFMNRADMPDEEEQFEALAAVVVAMKGAPVTFRTLDIGGDKIAKSMGAYLGQAANPALGLRAVRLSLKYPHLLKTQFRAMMRAGAFGPVRILLPLVTTAQEMERARLILHACHAELVAEKAQVQAEPPPLGAMIEIPAAALAADSLAAVSDFFSLGTNDLVQYTVAIDRGDDQVAELYNPLNPAVLRLMEFAIEAASRAGIPVSICGEMGADTRYTPLLLGLGIRSFSTGAASLPRLKARLRSLQLAHAQEHAREVMKQYDPVRISELVETFDVKK